MEQQQREIEIVNGKIASTALGFDGGTMLATLQIQGKGIGVGFGGYVLHVPGSQEAAFQTSFGMEYIAAILHTVGVQHWEQLTGQACRMAIQGNQILGIGHLIEDAWFYPRELGLAFDAIAQRIADGLSMVAMKEANATELAEQLAEQAEDQAREANRDTSGAMAAGPKAEAGEVAGDQPAGETVE